MKCNCNNISLNNKIIQVWTYSFDETIPTGDMYYFLSTNEQQRAKQFRFEHHRNRYITLHYMIRSILSHNLDKPLDSIEILTGSYGKPYIKNQHINISFNASNTKNLIAFTCTLNRNIGIDVETIDPMLKIEEIIPSLFSKNELTVFNSKETDKQLEYILCFWTAKEAYIKALGFGLHYPMNEITLSLSKNNGFSIIKTKRNDPHIELFQTKPTNSSILTIAYDGQPAEILFKKWYPELSQ